MTGIGVGRGILDMGFGVGTWKVTCEVGPETGLVERIGLGEGPTKAIGEAAGAELWIGELAKVEGLGEELVVVTDWIH